MSYGEENLLQISRPAIYRQAEPLMMMLYPSTFGYEKVNSSEYTTHTDIQQRFEPSLWPWPWTQQRSRFMMMYHQAEFGSQWIRSSKEVTETDMSPVIVALKTATHFFPHDTMDYNDISPYQVWLWKAQWFRTYHPDKYWLKLWMFAVTLTVNTGIQYYN